MEKAEEECSKGFCPLRTSMNLLCWNIRGLNSPLKQHEVANLLKKKKVDVCALVEAKISELKIVQMCRFRLKKWKFASNATTNSYARIVLFWNPDTVSVDVMHTSDQAINVRISSLVTQSVFGACFVYGRNTIIQRRSLWNDLRSWSPNSPWLVLGDFNAVLSQNDRHGEMLVSSYEISDFHSCCTDIGLSDVTYSGSHFTWNRGNKWSKIDRVMLNPLWSTLDVPVAVDFSSPGSLSDHSQAWVQLFGQMPQEKRIFKFFNMWAQNDNFLQIVEQHWRREVRGYPMFILCSKLKSLKRPLRSLNQLHFGHISQRVANVAADLDRIQQLRLSNLDCSRLFVQETDLRLKLINLKSAEKMFFSQKLKIKFLEEGDKGSRFFHSLLNQKHRRNFIASIRNESGTLTTSPVEVGAVFVDYYKKLLGSIKMTTALDESVIPSGPRLDRSNWNGLLAPVTPEEIRLTVFGIDNDKAPGPDGFSSLFFKKAWGIVGTDFCAAVQDFFSSGRLLKQVNHSIIALVPKITNASCPTDFRPISCCNVVYKVIAKILSSRLAHALLSLISPMQSAFLGGRKMVDNIHLLQELLRLYSRKRASPRCMIKVDFKKAFDSLQWPFIRNVLLQLGFPVRFTDLVMACVESPAYSISVNGQLFGFFKGQSGIRQGDPLSPYLFIACMEYFSRMLLLAAARSEF